MSSLNGSLLREEEAILNNTLSSITSNFSINSKQKQIQNFEALVRKNIKVNSAIVFIIRNISSYITLSPLSKEKTQFGFDMLNIVIVEINKMKNLLYFLSDIFILFHDNMTSDNEENIVSSFEKLFDKYNGENKDFFAMTSEFCDDNMRKRDFLSQSVGIKCFHILSFFFLDIGNLFLKNIWDIISIFADDSAFNCKKEILSCINEIILKSKESFRPFVSFTLSKMMNFLIVDDDNLKALSLENIKSLFIYCREELKKLKEQIKNLISVTIGLSNEKIQALSKEILQEIGNEEDKTDDKLMFPILFNYNNENEIDKEKEEFDYESLPIKLEDLEDLKSKKAKNEKIKIYKSNSVNVINNNQKEIKKEEIISYQTFTPSNQLKDNVFSIKREIVEKDNENNNNDIIQQKDLKQEYEGRISSLLAQMKEMSDKQVNLLDIITNIQKTSNEQITMLNNRIQQLESTIRNLKNKNENEKGKLPLLASKLKESIASTNEQDIINVISQCSIDDIKSIDRSIIVDTLLKLCTVITKGKNIHEVVMFIKSALIMSNIKLKEITKKNLKDVFAFLTTESNFPIKDEDLIDISLLNSYLNKSI